MPTILSVRAVSHIVERHVNVQGPQELGELLRWIERMDVAPDRARQALDLSLVRGRLVRRTDNGQTLIRRPKDWRAA
jgi:hypothetical protein